MARNEYDLEVELNEWSEDDYESGVDTLLVKNFAEQNAGNTMGAAMQHIGIYL